MKNIIIGGVPRAGKSTISKKVAEKLGYSWIPLDPVIEAFGKTFPDLNIRHTKLSHDKICDNFSVYVNNYLHGLLIESAQQNMGFVIESYHFKPSLLNTNILNTFETCFIGYSEISIDIKLQQIRKYDTNDWTQKETDEKMKELIDQFLCESGMYKNECEKYGVQYFDVSTNFKNKQEEIINYIITKSGKN